MWTRYPGGQPPDPAAKRRAKKTTSNVELRATGRDFFGFLLTQLRPSCKAVPEVTSTFTGHLHNYVFHFILFHYLFNRLNFSSLVLGFFKSRFLFFCLYFFIYVIWVYGPLLKTSAKVGEHGSLGALRVWVFGFLLIEISSRKAVPEVTSTFTGPLHDEHIVERGEFSFDPYHTIPWVCYRRRNQWLRLALALFCLPLIWLARARARVPYHTMFTCSMSGGHSSLRFASQPPPFASRPQTL